MSVEELVEAFEHSNKKANDIRRLSIKFGITEREVIETLKSFNIKTPRIVSRSEVMEFSDDKFNEIERKPELELDDSDITPAISIIKKFEEMGWTKKEGIERTIQLSYYIETKLGLDCFEIYLKMLEYIVKSSGVKGLEQDLDSIQNEKGFSNTREGKLTGKVFKVFEQIAEGIVNNLVDELADEPEAKPEKEIDEKPFLVKVYEAYNMLTNPEQYKFEQWRKKKAEKKVSFQEGLEVLRGVLG